METIEGKKLVEVVNVKAGGRNIKLYKLDDGKKDNQSDKSREQKSMLSSAFGGVKNDPNN